MSRKEMIAMLLAGGQGSRLGVLTQKVAKPAVPFGGKYRIIDFPLSNCVNSGIDTVGVLTQYQPLQLNKHIGIGIPWDLDRNDGGVTILPPYEKNESSRWYGGTADAITQNIRYIDSYAPEYVLILSGDHIYKMDYELMLDFHKAKHADVTLAVIPVPWEEASRFGVVLTNPEQRITEFEEKPAAPRSNLASMGIYIFTWRVLKQALLALDGKEDCDFGKDVLPYLLEGKHPMAAYEFNGYWKDVGTLEAYWKANMELIELIPEFNLYEEYWKIYTRTEKGEPLYIAPGGSVERSLVSGGSEISGSIRQSVLGYGVKVGKGSRITDSIVMSGCCIGENVCIEKAIIAENTVIGDGAVIGEGEEQQNMLRPDIYREGLVTIGEDSVIPQKVRIGKNTAVYGITGPQDYPNGILSAGSVLIMSE